MAFSVATILLFILFGVLTYNEVENLQNDINQSNKDAAHKELLSAIFETETEIREYSKDFADWDEVTQQIRNPVYYAYWHDHRALKANILPRYVHDAALYNASGNVVDKLDTSKLPYTIDTNNLTSYVELIDKKPELITFIKIHDKNIPEHIIGYAGIRSDMMSSLKTMRQYNYLDRLSIVIHTDKSKKIPIADLIDHMSFSLKPNPMMNEIMNITVDMLYRMTFIVAIPILFLYPLVTYLISRPLRSISQHIDQLKADDTSEDLQDFNNILAVSELEKVRISLNEYHTRLSEVHTSLDDKNKELWTLAHHDPLTGALNRRAFDEHWRSLQEMFTGGRLEICLAIFDVNNFKAYNDSYGHHVGDEVLKGIAYSITQVLRQGEKLYRLGGDEFACIFVECDEPGAVAIAERCEKSVAAYPFSQFGIQEPVRISVGIAHADYQSHDNLNALQWQADLAMYTAKQPGKSHIASFSEDMNPGSKGLISSWANNIIYEAISDGTGICMYYQPIVDMQSRQPVYFEALIRIHRDDKIVMPNDIFHVVETRRLEAELDLAILKQVNKDMQAGVIPENTGVSINISGVSIIHPEIIKQLEVFSHFLQKYRVVLEITETALITQIGTAADNLVHLRKLGFLVALDDFGSGYSSVRYLATMPVDMVKFDISLIRDLNDDSQKTIVKHLASMIAETGHKLVAEGIETEEVFDKVAALDFLYGQGFLFGEPIINPNCHAGSR